MNNGEKIKICFTALKAYPIFNPRVGTYFGGAEVDLYYLATELAKDNSFEISFIVADYKQPQEEVIENVRIIKTIDFKKPIRGILKVWNGLKLANADIYMTKTASVGTPLITLFCKKYGKKYIYRTAHSYECDGTYLKQHFLVGRIFNWSMKKADLVFAQNQKDADNLYKNLKIQAIVVPNGHKMTTQTFDSLSRDTILWVGRDTEFKRPGLFLKLAEIFPNENFTMICQTLEHSKKYDMIIETAKKLKNVNFFSHVPFNKIDTFFQKAKLFVNTSQAEGFPNTFIQACKAATPILSLNVNPDGFLDKYNCGICCNNDFKRFTDSLDFILTENRYIEMGKNARKYLEQNHNIKIIVEEYKQIFRQEIRTKT